MLFPIYTFILQENSVRIPRARACPRDITNVCESREVQQSESDSLSNPVNAPLFVPGARDFVQQYTVDAN